jgi:DnaJ-class molecular chaperone
VDLSYFIFMAIITMVVLFFVSRGLGGGGRMRCTRCDGSGHVNEKWPDPSAPGGWHIVEGQCPKCKGKGRV